VKALSHRSFQKKELLKRDKLSGKLGELLSWVEGNQQVQIQGLSPAMGLRC
jgi:hypothetical protein